MSRIALIFHMLLCNLAGPVGLGSGLSIPPEQPECMQACMCLELTNSNKHGKQQAIITTVLDPWIKQGSPHGLVQAVRYPRVTTVSQKNVLLVSSTQIDSAVLRGVGRYMPVFDWQSPGGLCLMQLTSHVSASSGFQDRLRNPGRCEHVSSRALHKS